MTNECPNPNSVAVACEGYYSEVGCPKGLHRVLVLASGLLL